MRLGAGRSGATLANLHTVRRVAPSVTETMMTQEQKIIRAKIGLLELAKQLGNVSQACKIDALLPRQLIALRSYMTRRRAGLEGDQPQEADFDEPHADRHRGGGGGAGDRTTGLGQVRVSEALKRRGLSISPAGMRCVW